MTQSSTDYFLISFADVAHAQMTFTETIDRKQEREIVPPVFGRKEKSENWVRH